MLWKEEIMKKFFRALICVLGFAVLPCVIALVYRVVEAMTGIDPSTKIIYWVNILIYVVAAIISGIIFIILSKRITENFSAFVTRMEERLAKQSARKVLASVIGLAIGLFIAFLICTLLDKIQTPLINVTLSVLIYVIFGYIGVRLFQKNLVRMFKGKDGAGEGTPKVVDTSAIIDGRIFDLLRTGIVEGKIIVPEFVLDELRHIADSADPLKRTKGSKGLDALQEVRKEKCGEAIEITTVNYEEIAEVDAKLLRLAEELKGKVITNDFNLNKVAGVKGVPVINVNDISNAVKSVLTAGEELTIEIIKEGKEYSQGVGYLDDGTMIVVENGRKFIGEQLPVVVTSVLQTSAGRMIFAKPRD